MDLFESYKAYLTSGDKPASLATVKNYLADAQLLSRWYESTFKSELKPQLITNDVISSYIQHLKSSSASSSSSIERRVSSLRKFVTFLNKTTNVSITIFDNADGAKAIPDAWRIAEFATLLRSSSASDATLKNYLGDVKQFISWFARNVSHTAAEDVPTELLSKIDDGMMSEYVDFLSLATLSPASINRKLSSLRRYLGFIGSKITVDNISPVIASRSDMSAGKHELSSPQNEIVTSSLPHPSRGGQAHDNIDSDHALLAIGHKPYSSFAPLRMLQKMGTVTTLAFDASIVAVSAVALEKMQYLSWILLGKQIFSTSAKSGLGLGGKLISSFKLPAGTETVAAGKSLFTNPIGKSGVRLLSQLHPTHPGFAGLPVQHRILGHAKYTRPSWYKKYHSHSIVHYFHFAALILIMGGIGFGLYRSFVETPQKDKILAAAPTAPPRILSFQGRLTDSNDNPITSAKDLRFAIYNSDVSTGAALLWQETQYITADVDGIFSVLLGSSVTIPASVFNDNSGLYLGITVQSDSELTPRQQIATVAFAANSETLQGLYPITAGGAGTNNVVLALDSSGNLTIGGSATPTFSATGGAFTLSGTVLNLQTTSGSNSNININPDGRGLIEIQKPARNSTLNNNIPSAAGAVEIDDMFAVLATSAAQNAVTFVQAGAGPIFSASAGATTRFLLANNGTITASGYSTGVAQFNSSGVLSSSALSLSGGSVSGILPSANGGTGADLSAAVQGSLPYFSATGVMSALAPGVSGYVLTTNGGGSNPTWTNAATVGTNYWQRALGALAPASITDDLLIGGAATSSAVWQVYGVGANAGTASSSGQITFRGSTDPKLNVLNGEAFGIRTSPGGDAGLSEQFTVLNNGNVGIGTTNPNNRLQVAGGNIYASGGNIMASGNISAYGGTVNFDSGGTYNIFLDGTQLRTNNKFVVSNGVGIGYNAPTSGLIVSGNIGIGSISPAAPLDVVGDIYGSSGISLYNTAVSDDTIEAAKFCTGDGESNCVTDFSSISAGASLWQRALGALAPGNITDDVLVGGSATASALIKLGGTTNAISYFNTGGNVGIGTTNPTSTLHVEKSQASGFLSQIINTSGAGGAGGLTVESTDGNGAGDTFRVMTFRTVTPQTVIRVPNYGANQNHLYLGESSGTSVGFGTTSPRAKVDIEGSASISGTLSFRGTTDPKINVLNGEAFGIRTSAGGDAGLTERFTVLNNGNIGIGTTGPATALDIDTSSNLLGLRLRGTAETTEIADMYVAANGALTLSTVGGTGSSSYIDLRPEDNDYGLIIRDGSGGSTNYANLYLNDAATDYLNITVNGTNSTTGLVIAAGGNVGIGTTTPGGSLHIKSPTGQDADFILDTTDSGNATADTNIIFREAGSSRWALSMDGSDGDKFNIYNYGLGSNVFSILSDGNIGIGTTSPLSRLDVRALSTASIASISGTTSNAALAVDNNGVGDLFVASKSGATKFVVKNSGNIGVGTSLPGYLFDVQGGTGIVGQFSGRVIGGDAVNSNEFATLGQISGGAGQFWQRAAGALAPTNITDDVLVGGSATASALIKLGGTTNAISYFNTGGNVGIGSTSPGYKLDVNGTGYFGGKVSINNASLGSNSLDVYTASAGTIAAFQSNGTAAGNTLVTIAQGNAVTGITEGLRFTGNATTRSSIAVYQSGIGSANLQALALSTGDAQSTYSVNGVSDWSVGLDNSDSDSFKISGSNTLGTSDFLTILTGGNVGIGTTAPGNKLAINDGTYNLLFDGNEIYHSDNNAFYIASGQQIIFQTNKSGTPIDALTIRESGNVGIGTNSPIGRLHVEGAATGRALVTFNETGGQDIFTASASGTPRFVIRNDGNVGIGTTLPTQKLEVLGIAQTSGGYYISSSGVSLTRSSNDLIVNVVNAAAMRFNTTNLERMRIDAGGNLGIGTTAPLASLDVRAVNGTTSIASISGLTSNAALAVDNNGVGDIFAASKSGSLKFVIKNSGNIGIGTSLPGYLFDLQGGTGIVGRFSGRVIGGDAASSNEFVTLGQLTGGAGYWQLNANALSPSISTYDLLLGATSTSSAKFGFINNAGGTPTATISSNFSIQVPTGGANAAKINILNGGSLGFRTSVGGDAGATERLTILNGGNIGVGTTAPGNLFDIGSFGTSATVSASINANTSYNTQLKFREADDTFGASIMYEGSDNQLQLRTYNGDSQGAAALTLSRSSGNIAIGTTSTSNFKLKTAGSIGPETDDTYDLGSSGKRWRDLYLGPASLHIGTDLNEGIIGYNITDNYIGIDADGNASAESVFTDAGNLGIGTTNPATFKLEVAGSIGPTATNTYDIGSIAKQFNNTYTQNLYINGSLVNPAGLTNYWQRDLGAVSPANITDDLLIGGSATSSASFQVYGVGTNAGTASSSGQISFRGTTDPKINVLNGEAFGIRTSAGGDAGLAERFTILNNGNVGIGSSTPVYPFDMTNSTGNFIRLKHASSTTPGYIDNSSTGSIYFSSNVTGADVVTDTSKPQWRLALTQAQDSFTIQRSPTGASWVPADLFYMASDGNIGLGTTTTSGGKIYAYGSATSNTTIATGHFDMKSGNNSTPLFKIAGTGTADLVNIVDNTTEVFTILDGGNVGIGSTAPNAPLDVTGDIYVSSGISTYQTAVSNGTIEATKFCTGDGESNCTTDFSTLTNYWQLLSKVVSPANSTYDLAIGGTATSSAKFQVFGTTNGTITAGTASTSGDLTFNGTSATQNINILKGSKLNFRTASTGQGDAGLADRMTLASNGNVGIGSTTPGARLDLGFSPSVPGNARLSSYSYLGNLYSSGAFVFGYNAKANETATGNVLVANTNGSVGYQFIQIDSGGGIQFHAIAGSVTAGNVASSERMRINPNGNVGIGTTAPVAKLDLEGSTTLAQGQALFQVNQLSTGDIMTASASGTTRFVLNASGNLGLNNINPRTDLAMGTDIGTFNGISIGAAANRDIRIGQDSTHNLVMSWKYNATAGNAYSVIENYAGNNMLGIQTNGGNVGIGTTTTTATLELTSTTAPDFKINSGASAAQISLNNANREWWIQADDSPDLFAIEDRTAGNLTRLAINGSGNVGIGTTTPIGLLHLDGRVTGKALALLNETGNQDIFTASASGTPRFVIRNNGNVGIGTMLPGAPLDVAGDIYGSSGISLYNTTVSDGTIEAAQFCTGDLESNCVTDFAALTAGSSYWQRLAGNLSPATLNDTISATSGASTVATFTSNNPSGTLANNTLINHNAAGTVTNLLNLTQSSGTVSNGITFTGTFGNLISATNFALTNAGNLDTAGTLTAGTANAFTVAATGDITTVTNETINGIDINAGAVSDVTTLTSSGSTTIGTGASSANTIGAGASSTNVIGSVTTPGALTLHGATTLDNTFTVSGSNLTSLGGNLTVTGTAWTATPTISGLITATSGLTTNGALTANNTFTLGDNGDTGSINTSDWDIDITGVLTGISGITNDGVYTQTGSSQNTFTGNLDATSGLDVSGANLTVADDIYVSSGISTFATAVSNGTIEATKFCTGDLESNCVTDFAALTAGSSYWQRLAGNLSPATLNDTISATTSAAVALTLTQTGAFNALLVEDQASDTSPFIINQDGNVGIGTTTASEALHVNGNIRMNAVGGKIGSSSNIATHFIEVETSDGDINMAARGDITLNLDSDNNGAAHTFQIWKDSSDESGTQLFSVSETGDVLVSSNINTLTATTLNIGTATQTGLTLGRVGATTTINGSTLTVGPTAWTATPTISGLITATSGLTSNGTLTVSNGQTLTAAGVVTLGDGGDNFSISSNALDVSTAGVISGATGITSSGNITFSGLTAARGVFTTTGGLLTTTAASQALVDSLSDETGSGLAVFGTSPAITTSLTTGSSSFDLLNATATTINFAGGATTALNIGPGGATGATVNVAGGSGATGCTIDGATGNLTCAGTITGSGGALTNLWQLVSKVVSPANSTYDLTVGGTATSSAAFQVFALSKDAGTITAGTASTSGDLTFRAAASDINLLGNAVFNIKNSIGGDAGLVTRLTLAANGNLGIGTTTPIGKLHVEGAATGRALATFNETGGQDIFTASASGTPRFVIRNSGNVGIGTILPGQLLSVAGFIEGQRFVDSSNNNFFIDPAATGVSLTTAGFSGLGTQAPVTYLHVDGATTLAQGQSLAILNQTGASDIFTASTSGTTRFLIRGSGNVGVGSSTNPLGLFSVNGLTTAAQGQALVLFNQTSTGDLFSASTSGTTRFTIKNSGNVGIGNISNPLGLLNLDGATTTAQGQALAIFNQTGTADIFSASASGSTKFVINNGGNVGIGTTAPGAKLVVSGTTSTSILLNNSGGTGFFQLQEAGTTRGYLGYGDAGSLFTNATSNSVALRSEGDLYLGTGAVIGLSLDTTGNVGIGSLGVTSSFPRAELDISGSASISGIISFRGTSTDPKIDLLNGEHLGIRTSAGGSSLSEKFTILNNGNVGVGTTAPTRAFSVIGDYAGSGDFWMSGSTTTFVQGNGGDWRITVDAGSGAGTQAFRVNDTGNVDIGATDGSTKLVVTDTISAGNSGGITINNEASNSTSTPFRIISDNGSTNNVKFRIDNDGDVFTDGSTTIGTPADVAENYPVNDNSIEAGDLVATTTDIQRVDKMDNGQVVESEDISILGRATNETSGKLIGVVSTNPGLLLSGHTNGKPVALSGRVPVKVSTINGPISAGDPLTSSPIPGVAMKATGVGMIVGRALENYTSSDINQVAKINTFVSTGWYDSTAQLAQSGNLNISGNDEQSFEAWAGGYKFENKGGFADAAIARLTAGIVKTQQLVVNGTSTFLGTVQMQTLNVASAISTGSINAGTIAVSNLSIGGQALSEYILSVVSNSSLVIGGQGGIISPVADIERINTDIISPLATGEVNIDGNVKTKNLSVNGDATVSGTLRADKIIANDIEGLNARIASIAANTITASNAAITNIYNNTYLASGSAVASGGASMIASSIDTNFASIGSLSANLAYVPSLTSDFGTFSQGLMSFGATSLADTSIAGQLSINGSLILADNTINTLRSPLEIQPLRQGALSFMGGLVAIDIDGNLSVAGNATFAKDVTVQGTLAANIISPVPNEDLILQLPGFDDGTTLATNRPGITVKNGSGSAVLKITDVGDIIASGAALASQFQVVRGAQADTSLITSVATASAGTATIKAGQLERTIQNSRVTADSLIYITATSDTSGKAPFVARQVAEDVQNNIKGSFTVRIPQAISLDAKVNWWIIN